MARLEVGDPVRVVGAELGEYRGQAGFVERVDGMRVTVRLHASGLSGGLAVFWKDQVIPIREASGAGEKEKG